MMDENRSRSECEKMKLAQIEFSSGLVGAKI